jgi:hypothetical protein
MYMGPSWVIMGLFEGFAGTYTMIITWQQINSESKNNLK